MSGNGSIPIRLEWMERQCANRFCEHQIGILAEEFGLDPCDVRHELEEMTRHIRRYGSEPLGVALQRLEDEFDLDPDELREEVAQTQARLQACGVVL